VRGFRRAGSAWQADDLYLLVLRLTAIGRLRWLNSIPTSPIVHLAGQRRDGKIWRPKVHFAS
jgi:hypothetical protein